jgi:hypothetical protein
MASFNTTNYLMIQALREEGYHLFCFLFVFYSETHHASHINGQSYSMLDTV